MKTNWFISLFFVLVLFGNGAAQPLFQHRLIADRNIRVGSSAFLPDGSMFTAGISGTTEWQTIYLSKFNADGSIAWVKESVDTDSLGYATTIASVLYRSDGVVVVAANIFVQKPSIVLLFCREDGTIVTAMRYSSPAEYDGLSVTKVIETQDHGMLIIGQGRNDSFNILPLAMLCDKNGGVLWSEIFATSKGMSSFWLSSAAMGTTGNYAIGGGEFSTPGVVMTLASDGTLQSSTRDTGTGAMRNAALLAMQDGGFISVGTVGQKGIITSFNASGALQWSTAISFFDFYNPHVVALTPDGLVCVCGDVLDNDPVTGKSGIFFLQNNGVIHSAYTLQIPRVFSKIDAIQPSVDKSLLLALSVSDSGSGSVTSPLFMRTSFSTSECNITPSLISQSEFSPAVVHDITVTKLPVSSLQLHLLPFRSISYSEMEYCTMSKTELQLVRTDIQLYPNPVEDQVIAIHTPITTAGRVVVIISNISGQEVYRSFYNVMDGEIRIDLGTIASGMYNIALLDESSYCQLWRGKLIKK